jgi:hypothetical protein
MHLTNLLRVFFPMPVLYPVFSTAYAKIEAALDRYEDAAAAEAGTVAGREEEQEEEQEEEEGRSDSSKYCSSCDGNGHSIVLGGAGP